MSHMTWTWPLSLVGVSISISRKSQQWVGPPFSNRHETTTPHAPNQLPNDCLRDLVPFLLQCINKRACWRPVACEPVSRGHPTNVQLGTGWGTSLALGEPWFGETAGDLGQHMHDWLLHCHLEIYIYIYIYIYMLTGIGHNNRLDDIISVLSPVTFPWQTWGFRLPLPVIVIPPQTKTLLSPPLWIYVQPCLETGNYVPSLALNPLPTIMKIKTLWILWADPWPCHDKVEVTWLSEDCLVLISFVVWMSLIYISFIQHMQMLLLCLLESQHPLLFFISMWTTFILCKTMTYSNFYIVQASWLQGWTILYIYIYTCARYELNELFHCWCYAKCRPQWTVWLWVWAMMNKCVTLRAELKPLQYKYSG